MSYDFNHAVNMLKQAVDFAEAEGDFTQARVWAGRVEEAGNELKAEIKNLDEGARLMHSFATGGESKLLKDWQELDDMKCDWDKQVTELRGGG